MALSFTRIIWSKVLFKMVTFWFATFRSYSGEKDSVFNVRLCALFLLVWQCIYRDAHYTIRNTNAAHIYNGQTEIVCVSAVPLLAALI